jgi:lycopene cyclase domain-containing protein
MKDSYVYLCVDFCCFIVPFLFSFHPSIQFYKLWRVFLPVTASVATFFIAWDILFTHLGVWGFNPRYVLGYYFFNLPIEELLFFICIPYACMFTYYCFDKFLKVFFPLPLFIYLTWLLVAALLVIAGLNYQRLYTSVTFVLLSVVLMVLAKKKAPMLPVFYLTYIATLLPFFISNGILTGSWIDEPVVWYNNAHNLRVRLLTIPVEDLFYGMLLQIGNVAGFVFFSRRSRIKMSNAQID